MKYVVTFLINFFVMGTSFAQQIFPLYQSDIPNSKPWPDEEKTEISDGITRISKISVPTLTAFFPSKNKANGTAIIIFPGGGYWTNSIAHEGYDVAKKFNEIGVTAFVLKYRIPNEATMINKEIGPLQDAQQAIKTVRMGAGKWNLNDNRIGIMGFSAGGHLASTAGTHFNNAVIENKENISLRPDFMLLIYAVISFRDSVAHIGSRDQLIGELPAKNKIDLYSNELQITDNTPPAFLVHASDDNVVKAENSIFFYQQLLKHNVPAELHIYQSGGHGFGMNNKTTKDKWMDRCKNWMEANGWLTRSGK
ncbi:MAG: alpha/beta hydrolase [Ginsengibacter sp.]